MKDSDSYHNTCTLYFLQVNLSNANLEGALTTGNTSFKGSNINGAGMWRTYFVSNFVFLVSELFFGFLYSNRKSVFEVG